MMFLGTGAYTTVLLFKLLQVSPWLGCGLEQLYPLRLRSSSDCQLCVAGCLFRCCHGGLPFDYHSYSQSPRFEEVSIPLLARPSSMQFSDIRAYVIIAVVLLAIILIIIQRMERSRFGFRLRALRQKRNRGRGHGDQIPIRLN